MENNNKMDQLRALIKTELDLCDATSTPYVCALKAKNYEKVESMIIDKVAKEGHSVNTAITALEREYNPDYDND